MQNILKEREIPLQNLIYVFRTYDKICLKRNQVGSIT